MLKKTIAATTLLALPVTALAATTVSASADTDRNGRCGAGTYELSVDTDDDTDDDTAGYEISVDLDRVAPGSRWTIAVRHDGKRITTMTRVADREGDLDLETFRADTAGSDTFAFTAKRIGSKQRCGAKVSVA